MTDFGEARTKLEQTRTVLKSRTENTARGTLGFMAPECLPGTWKLWSMGEADLMKADVWSFSALLHSLLAPDSPPFVLEVEDPSFDFTNPRKQIGDIYSAGFL